MLTHCCVLVRACVLRGGWSTRGCHSGILERGESEEVDQLLADYATADTDKITFEEFKRGVRKALKRHKKENKAMGSQGVAASHLGR
jgi:hypothetical protein